MSSVPMSPKVTGNGWERVNRSAVLQALGNTCLEQVGQPVHQLRQQFSYESLDAIEQEMLLSDVCQTQCSFLSNERLTSSSFKTQCQHRHLQPLFQARADLVQATSSYPKHTTKKQRRSTQGR